ncbi:MAG: hypothetical protein P3C10_11495 [Gemmatimonadota bacterium]|nr:hypothetical protein [Gemmatimonadota bacterium]
MSRAALNDDVDVLGGTHAMQAAVGDEERHHLSADEDDFVQESAEREGCAPNLLRIGMIELDDHATEPSRCRR